MLNEREELLFDFLEIIYKMSRNEAIFFLGSGFSINFNIDNWQKFVNELIDSLVEEINRPETNFIFTKMIKNVLSDLEIIKNKINNKIINLDFALDMIYFCIEFNPNKITTENKIKADFIKKIYLEHFKVDTEKLDKKNTNVVLLNKIREKLRKIITTNYDNLFLFDYLNFLDSEKHFAMPYFEFENLEHLFSKETDRFYFPIHGNVLNDNFQNKEWNIWEKYVENNSSVKKHQSPIVDSLSSFQKNYIKDQEFLKKFLQNFLIQASLKNNIVIFFGYSFNDSFVSKEIIETLNDLTSLYKQKTNDLIYIVYDDLTDYIMEELNLLKNAPHGKPLLSYEFVKYLNFSTIFLEGKNKNAIEKFHKNIIEINSIKEKLETELSFLNLNEKRNAILNVINNLQKFNETKNIVYKSLLNEIKNFYDDYNYRVPPFIKQEEILFEKYFFYISKMKILGKSNFEIFQDIKNRFVSESENISLYLYAFLFCFSDEKNKNKNELYIEACDLLFKRYIPQYNSKDGKKIKLPEIYAVINDYFEMLSIEEQKKILEVLQ